MNRKYILIGAVVVIAVIVSASFLPNIIPGPTKEIKKVKLIMAWVPTGAQSFFYVAKDKGYYAAEGLDVDILPGRGSLDSIANVDKGTATLGVADFPTLISAIGQGAKLKAVGVAQYNTNLVIIAPGDVGIKSLKDLEGRKGVTLTFGNTVVMWPLFAGMHGIDTSKISMDLVNQGMWTIVAERKADFAVDTVEDIPLYGPAFKDKKRETSIETFRFPDYGFNPYGQVFFTKNDLISSDPDLVKGFLKAIAKGLQDAYKNPDEAISILFKYSPGSGDKKIDLEKLNIFLDTVGRSRLDKLKGTDLLRMEQDKVEFTIQVVMTYAKIKPVLSKDVYTTSLIS